MVASFSGARAQAPVWKRTAQNDPLHKVAFDEWRLEGKFLVTPRQLTLSMPLLVVHCTGGKFMDGQIDVGTVLNTVVIKQTTLLGGTTFPTVIPVEFRLDDRKLQTDNWSPSTDGTAAFFSGMVLANLLYGHILMHKAGKGDQVHQVTLGMSEYLAGQVQMQFEMPDATEIGYACGVTYQPKR